MIAATATALFCTWPGAAALSLMPKLGQIKNTIQDPLGRCSGVMAIPALYAIENGKVANHPTRPADDGSFSAELLTLC